MEVTALSRTYEVALSDHLKGGANAGLKKAASLGRQAVSLGLETLDLARIHERAFLNAISLKNSSNLGDGFVKRAQNFFIEAIKPMEHTHLAAVEAKLRWNQLSATLHRRTNELMVSIRDVRKETICRKAAEETLKKRRKHHSRLLAESRSLQKELRRVAHQVLSDQENERRHISHQLHDEVAQGLLAINVRLFMLQQKKTEDTRKLLKSIADGQRLIERSGRTLRRFSRQFRTPA